RRRVGSVLVLERGVDVGDQQVAADRPHFAGAALHRLGAAVDRALGEPLDGGLAHARLLDHHERVALALLAKAVLEDVEALLGLGPGQREAVAQEARQAGRTSPGNDDAQEPSEEYSLSMVDYEASPADHVACPPHPNSSQAC